MPPGVSDNRVTVTVSLQFIAATDNCLPDIATKWIVGARLTWLRHAVLFKLDYFWTLGPMFCEK